MARPRAAGGIVDEAGQMAPRREAGESPESTAVRTVGRRTTSPTGVLRAPTPEEEDWVRRMSAYRTRVPKGVFRYASAAEANADWERWRVALLAEGAGIDRADAGR